MKLNKNNDKTSFSKAMRESSIYISFVYIPQKLINGERSFDVNAMYQIRKKIKTLDDVILG